MLIQLFCLYRELKDGSLCDNNIQDQSNLTLVLHTETGVRVSDAQLVLDAVPCNVRGCIKWAC